MASAGSAARPSAADMCRRWPSAGWLAERTIRAGGTAVGWICAAFGLPEVPGAAIIPVSRGAMGRIWPQAGDPLITCHRDLHPDNMLVDSPGELVLLDWDDAGPTSPGRELARLLANWHVHDGKPDAAAVPRTLAAYQAAGGPGRIRDEQSFAMLIACMLNFLHSQASVALDPDTAAEHRQHACAEIPDTLLARLPTRALIAQLINLAAPLTN
jgi:Phosphotransferase enzyme family